MEKVITTSILKNRITDSNGLLPDMIKFRNIKINGRTVGCSGFLKYSNGVFVYVNTDKDIISFTKGKILCRIAKNENDYCGDVNHFVSVSYNEKHDFKLQCALRDLAYGKMV